jgi:uncharacterized protein involved in exopolysaccharide biosynthesis
MVDVAHLWVCTGANVGRVFALDRTEHTIGRAGGGALFEVDDERVSSLHCAILSRSGRHFLRDLGSTNGTFVNRQQIREVFLNDGDLIQVGETILELVSERATIEMSTPGSEAVPRGIRAHAREALHRARGSERESAGLSSAHVVPDPAVPYTPPPPARAGAHAPPPALPPEYVAHVTMGGEEDELSLRDLLAQAQRVLQFFLPYWRSIVVTTCLFMVGGAGSYFLKPPPRRAVFEVSLRPQTTQNPVASYNRQNVGFFTSAEQNFRAGPLIEKTLRALGETDISPERLASIQKDLEFYVVGLPKPNGPITYRGEFVSNEPEWSIRFLEEHFEIYLETEIDKTLKKIRLEAEFLTKRLEDAEKELRRTETALLEFKKQNIDGLPDQARQYYDYLFQLRQAESAAAMNAARLSAEVQLDRQRLNDEKPMVEDKVTMTQPYQAALVDVNRQLASARAEGLGPDHPRVLALQDQAQKLRELAESARNDAITEVRRNPLHDMMKKSLIEREVSQRIARQEAARVARDLERLEKIVERLPELEAEYAELNRTYTSTQKLHTTIFETLQTTKMQLDLERASIKSRYDVIAPPSLEFVSVRKNIMNRAMSSGGAGFVVGLLLAALRQLKRMHAAGLLAPKKKTPAAAEIKALSIRQP